MEAFGIEREGSTIHITGSTLHITDLALVLGNKAHLEKTKKKSCLLFCKYALQKWKAWKMLTIIKQCGSPTITIHTKYWDISTSWKPLFIMRERESERSIIHTTIIYLALVYANKAYYGLMNLFKSRILPRKNSLI